MKYKIFKTAFISLLIINFFFGSVFLPFINAPYGPRIADASCSSGQTSSSNTRNKSNARVGGVALDQAATFLANMDDIVGAYYDENLDRIVFVGKKNTTLPEFNKDDLAVAIKAVIFKGTIPAVSIEDDANTPTNNMKRVYYYGGIENTKFGKVLYDADIKLKKYVAGYDENQQQITSSVTGYKSFFDRLLEKQNFDATVPSNSRFWIVPQLITLKKDDTADSFVFDQVKMEVKTEAIYQANDPQWDAAMNEFAQHHTQNYDQFAQETPAYAQAKQLGKIVSVIKWLSDNNIPSDFQWAHDYAPKIESTPIQTPKYWTPMRQGANGQSFSLSGGGVQYTTANTYNQDNGTSSALKTASESVNAPKEEIHWTFTKDGSEYDSVAVAADAFRSLGSFSTSATDMSFPIAGDLSLSFVRSYSSFSGGQNGLGRGWSFMPAQLVDNKPVANVFLTGQCSSDTHKKRYKVAFTGAEGLRETFTLACQNDLATYFPDDPAYHTKISTTHVSSTQNLYHYTAKDQTVYTFEEIYGANFELTKYNLRLLNIKDKNGNTITYNYDSQNRLASISDENNHTITLNYNTNNLISSISDWANRSVSYTYDAQWNLLTATDPRGNTTTYAYDTNNKLTSITDREGKVTIANTYTPEAKLATQKDAANVIKTFSYDETNKVITSTDSLTPSRISSLKYDDKARVLEDTDALTNKTVYTYGVEYAPLTIKDKRNNTISNTYDSNGNLTSITYPDNKKVEYEYNSKNQVTKVIDRRYGVTPKETTFTYNTAGDLTNVNESGRSTAFTYNSDGEALTKTDPLSKITTWTRDTFGNKLTEKNHLNQTTTFEYNNRGWLTKEIDAENKQTSYTYDNNQNQLTQTNAAGTTTHQYDKENRVKKTILPDTNDVDYTYNNSGSLATVVDQANNTTTYGYDSYQNLTSKLDALNRTTEYEYDKLNRRTGRETPLGKVAHWEYDGNGNVTKRIDENNQQTTYTYDTLNRLKVITYPDTSTVTNNYDDRGNLTSVVSPAGTTSYTYDVYNRLLQTTDPNGKVVNYEYDNADNLTKIIYPGSKNVVYSYDGANRLQSITDWNNSVTSFEYFNNGLLKKKTLPNGVVTTYSYDSSNRLSETSHKKGTTTLAQFNYTRNSLGNITTANESGSFVNGASSSTSTLLSQGKSIVASSQKTGYEAIKANDGVVAGSYWEAQNGYPATITVDLGASYAVDKVVMKVDWGTRTENVEILGSTDNSTFTTIVPAANYALGTVPVTFNAVNTRYVRLKVNSNSAASAAQIHEFEVWGQQPSAPSETEILNTTWTLSGNNGDAQQDKTIPANSLNGKSSAKVTFDLNGKSFGGGDDEASIIFIQNNEWYMANVTEFGAQNGLDGSQTVTIPLSSFHKVNAPSQTLNVNQNVSNLHARFWHSSAFSVDISSVKLVSTGSTPPPETSGVELLTQPWNMTGNNGSVEKYQTISSTALQGKSFIRITYDLHGLTALGGDASAIIFDQNGWKYISLSNYGQNGLNGSQTVDIPLSAFTGLNPEASVGTLHTRFWYSGPFTVDITSIKAMSTNSSSSNSSQTKNYTYDLLGRVLTATSQFGNNTYTYDKVGNMLTSKLGTQETTHTVNNDNQLTQKGSTTYSYDNKGNQTARGTTTLAYDFENRLKTFTPSGSSAIEYTYDGTGERLKKKVGGTTTKEFVNDVSGELTNVLVEKDVPSNTESYYLYGNGIISQGGYGSQNREYYLEDGMGNIRAVTNSNGDVTKSYSYDPYGNQFEGDNTAIFRFKGEHFDPNTSLTYMRARYYDPSTGRFISKDPVEGTLINPQSQNGYSYAHNDPINLSDPSGMVTVGICAGGGGALPGLYGDCIQCYVTDFKGVGRTTNYNYGGTTSTGGANLFIGGEITNASNVSDLAGKNAVIGGSARLGPGVAGDVQYGQGVVGVSGGVSPGLEPTYALPGEFHGGQQSTSIDSYKHWNEITPSDVVKFVVGLL